MVTLKFSITEKDLLYFYRDRVFHKKGISKSSVISIIVFTLFLLFLYKNKLFGEIKIILMLCLISILLIFFMHTGYPVIFFLKRNGVLKQILEKLYEQTIVFSDKEMQHTLNDGSTGITPYSAFTKIRTTKYAIYLFTSDISASIIPISAFKNNVDVEFVKSKFPKEER